jgi:NAD(P)H-flavin reductase
MDAAHARSMLPEPYLVSQMRRETHDVVTLSLDASERPFAFAPGQFNMLYAFAIGEVPISFSGDPSHTGEIIHTVKAVGAVSEALCRMSEGTIIGVRGPFGHPWPVDTIRGQDVLVIAGGLGLAPLRPVVYHLINNRADYGEVSLLVGARTPEDLLYHRELEHWKRRADIRVLTIVDRAGHEWKGRIGVVTALLDNEPIDPRRTVALVCGPEMMMRFTVRELGQRGLPDERIYASLELNMKCALGFCGHCQYGPNFVCKDGPVFRLDQLRSRFWVREV